MRGPEAEPWVVPAGKKQVRQKAWQSGMGRGQGGGRTREAEPWKIWGRQGHVGILDPPSWAAQMVPGPGLELGQFSVASCQCPGPLCPPTPTLV